MILLCEKQRINIPSFGSTVVGIKVVVDGVDVVDDGSVDVGITDVVSVVVGLVDVVGVVVVGMVDVASGVVVTVTVVVIVCG